MPVLVVSWAAALLLAAPAAVAVNWGSTHQAGRDNQAVQYTDGPSSSDRLGVMWTLPLQTGNLAGVLTNVVADSDYAYSLTAYQRQNYSAFSAILPADGSLLWSTNVVHSGQLFAAMGTQLVTATPGLSTRLITHSVDVFATPYAAHMLDAISTVDGSPSWSVKFSNLYDHASLTPDGGSVILSDYFEGIVTIVEGGTGTITSNFTALCVSPIVTVFAIGEAKKKEEKKKRRGQRRQQRGEMQRTVS